MDSGSGAPLFSVVIATYNWSEALRYSVRSALRQTLAEFEILVVGDGCTDDSAEVVASFGDPRVRWHNLAQNTGSQSAPNNEGIARARGRYVAYLGHDDLWHPTHLASLRAAFEADPAAVLAYSGTLLYGPEDSEIRGVAGLFAAGRYHADEFIPPSSFAHLREAVPLAGGWRPREEEVLPIDWALLRRLWKRQPHYVETGKITVFKCAAGWRRNSYRRKDLRDQIALTRRMETEPDFLECELLRLVRASACGWQYHMGPPPLNLAPGAVARELRRFKGLDPVVAPSPPPAPKRRWPLLSFLSKKSVDPLPPTQVRHVFNQGVQPYEWHSAGNDPRHGSFQWSGPAPLSFLDLTLAWPGTREVHFRGRGLMAICPEALDSLQIFLNDQPLTHTARMLDDGGFEIVGSLPTSQLGEETPVVRIGFQLSRTWVPREIDAQNADRRRLGLAWQWVDLRAV